MDSYTNYSNTVDEQSESVSESVSPVARTHNTPSRAECEKIIKKILMTEVLTKGTNETFKTAADFLKYFQSLYPAGDALTKQVQRAVKSLGMPKDDKGYFIINKTESQLSQDKELSYILKKTNSIVASLDECQTLFLKCDTDCRDYLYKLVSESDTFKDKFVTVVNSSNGLIFYTTNKNQLEVLLESLINK